MCHGDFHSIMSIVGFVQGVDIVGALELDDGSGKAEGKDGSVKHNLAHAKPSRPGRGRARLIGKTDDSLGSA